MNTGDKVETQAKAFTTATITFCEDTEDFKPANDTLNIETEAGKSVVGLLFFVGQRMVLGRFSGQEAVGV